MTQTLELTTAELALIENARKQEVLAQEAKALQNAARIEEDIRIANQQIERELGHRKAEHFLQRVSTSQFSLPTNDTYIIN
jgi:hypothetical protein